MNPALLDWFGELAVAQLWQVTALALVVGLIARVFCTRRPHLAYLLWLLVVIKCLTPPVIASRFSPFSWAAATTIRVAASSDPIAPAVAGESSIKSQAQSAGKAVPTTPVAENAALSSRPPFVSVMLDHPIVAGSLLTWLAGAGLLSALLVRKRMIFLKVLRNSTPASADLTQKCNTLADRLGARRRVQVLIARGDAWPAVFGVVRPTILLPAWADTASNEAIVPVLAHELIHVRRGDAVVNLVQLVAQVAWWFHPLVWWANLEARRERERACDEEVVRAMNYAPTWYARQLLNVLEYLATARRPVLPAGVSMLGITTRRLKHLADQRTRFHARTPRAYWLVALVLLLVVLPGAGLSREASLATDKTNQNRAAQPANDKGKAEPATDPPRRVLGGQVVRVELSTPEDTPAHRAAVTKLLDVGAELYRDQRSDGKRWIVVNIGDKWKGQPADLAYLKDLSHLDTVVIDCSKLPPDGLRELTKIKRLSNVPLDQVSDEQLSHLRGWKAPREISLQGDRFSDAALATVATMSRLNIFWISRRTADNEATSTKVTDAGLRHLTALAKLERLYLSGCPEITGRGLAQLAVNPALRELGLFQQIPLVDADIAELAKISSLKSLTLDASKLTAVGYSALPQLKNLETLNLNSALDIGDAVALELAKLSSLRALRISGIKLTDAGLEQLSTMTKLRDLGVWPGRFTGVGLRHVGKMKDLRVLSLSGELVVNERELKELLDSLPELHVLTTEDIKVSDEMLKTVLRAKKLRVMELGITTVRLDPNGALNKETPEFQNGAVLTLEPPEATAAREEK